MSLNNTYILNTASLFYSVEEHRIHPLPKECHNINVPSEITCFTNSWFAVPTTLGINIVSSTSSKWWTFVRLATLTIWSSLSGFGVCATYDKKIKSEYSYSFYHWPIFNLNFHLIVTINITYKCISKYLKHTFSFDNLVAKLQATYFMQPSVESRKRTVDLNSIVVSTAVISPQQTLAQ